MLNLVGIVHEADFPWGILVPIVAITGMFAVQLAKVFRPDPDELSGDDRAKLKRLNETLTRMEERVAVLETLLEDAKKRENSSHEKTV